MNNYFQYNDPIKIYWRKGTADDPYVPKVESQQVINGNIVLDEIPDTFSHVQIEGYYEVYNELPQEKEYVVNYLNGIVKFHKSQESKSVKASYMGKGIILYPAKRIYLETDDPNILRTLQDMIDEADNVIGKIDDFNLVLVKADQTLVKLELDIDTGNKLSAELKANILQASTNNDLLKASIRDAQAKKEEIDSSITLGQKTKSDLDISTAVATITKNDLHSVDVEAKETNEILSAEIISGKTLKTDLTNTISTASVSKQDLDDSIDEAEQVNTDLKATIVEGKATKIALDESDVAAKQTKVDLDNSEAKGKSTNTELLQTISEGEALKAELDSDILAGIQLDTDLKTHTEEANASNVALLDSTAKANTTKTDLEAVNVIAVQTKTDLELSTDTAVNVDTELKTTINEAEDAKSKLVTEITAATTLDTKLSQSIVDGEALNITLEQTTVNAETANTELSAATKTAEDVKLDVDASTTSAVAAKTNLDASITSGTSLNSELNTTIQNANTIDEELGTKIQDGGVLATDLGSKINTATLLKDGLEDSTTAAQTAKVDIDNAVQTGAVKLTELNDAINLAVLTDDKIKDSTAKAETVKADLDIANTTGQTLNDELADKIIVGTQLKTDLTSSTVEALDASEQIDGSVIAGKNKIEEMDGKLTEAESAIQNTNTSAEKANDVADRMGVFEAFDETSVYLPLNKVAYSGSSYVCIKETVAGILPSNINYWQVIAQAGSGSVNSVNSDNSGDLIVANPNTDVVISVNTGTGANQILKLDTAGELTADVLKDGLKNAAVLLTDKQKWDGKQDELGFTPEDSANKGQADGFAPLGQDKKIPAEFMPKINSVQVVADPSEREALTGMSTGDLAFEISTGQTYIYYEEAWKIQTSSDWENVKNKPSFFSSIDVQTIEGTSVGKIEAETSVDEYVIQAAEGINLVATSEGNVLTIGLDPALKEKIDQTSDLATNVADSSINGNILIDGTETVVYTHPVEDGYMHVPVTGDTNSGKYLKAGNSAGLFSWENILAADITQDASNRFVTDLEKQAWNSKLSDKGGQITGDLTINKGIPKLIFKVSGQENESRIFWNASAENDLGIQFDVSGSIVAVMKKDKTTSFNGDVDVKGNAVYHTGNLGVATETENGLMSTEDKIKLNSVGTEERIYVGTEAPINPPTNMVWIDLNK